MTRILVYMEHEGGQASDLSLQLLALARSLGDVELSACCAAGDAGSLVASALKHGAQSAFVAEHAAFSSYLGKPVSQALAAAVKAAAPDLVLLPASTIGNDLGPLTAATLEAPCLSDCDGLELDEGTLLALRTEFDARARVCYKAEGGPFFITVKDGVVPAAEQPVDGETTALSIELTEEQLRASVSSREVADKTVNLKDAPVIIGGGAGVGTGENFALLEKLAKRVGGEIGATRASVDAGWVSAERQIGQTGVTVRPDLYIACGISGAIQHVVGIRDAKTIVAINSDASAPIFRVSHYKIVGDLNTIVPKLLEVLG